MAEKKVIELEVNSNLGNLKQQLKQAQVEVQTLSEKFGATSKQAVEAAKSAAILKDKISDAKALTDAFNPDAKFKAVTGALTGVAGGFSVLTGAMGAFGKQNEDVEKAILKVQSAMAIASGLQAIGESIDSFKQLGAVIKSTAVFQGIYNFVQTGSITATAQSTVAKVADAEATVAQGTATVATTVATTGASAALKLLRIAMISTGIGALVAGVGLLIANFEAIKAPFKGVIQGFKDFGDWLGITDNKSNDNADKARIRSEATMNQIKKEADLRNRRFENQQRIFTDEDTAIGRQIALMKAQNKDTTDLERARLKASIAYQTSIVRETYSIEQQLKQKNILTVAELRAAAERTGDYAAWNKFEREMAAQRNANTKTNLAAYDAMEQAQNDLKIFEQELVNDATKNAKDKLDKTKESIKRKAEKEKEAREKEAEALKLYNQTLTAFYDSIESERQAKITDAKEKEQQELANKYEKLYELADKAGKSTKDLQEQQGKDSQAITKKYDDLEKVAKDEKDKLEKERLVKDKAYLEELTLSESQLKLSKLTTQYEADQLLYKDNKEILKALDIKYAKDKIALETETADKQKAIDKAVLEQKMAIQQQGLDVASQGIGLIKGLFEKSKGVQKAAVIAESAIGIAKMIISNKLANIGALATPQAIATSGAAAAPVIAMNNISTGIGIAANIAATAKALSALGGGGAPSGSVGGGGSPNMSAPQFNVVGQSGVNQLASLNQQPIQAYVVSGQVTSQQALDRNRLANATLGD